jgi:hypothetical protein
MKLPPPSTIVLCVKCDDVTPVAKDKHGSFCDQCYKAVGTPA